MFWTRHQGTTDGLFLALNVAAMLISFLAIIVLIDGVMGGTHNFLAAHGFRWFPGEAGETILGGPSLPPSRGSSECHGTTASRSATCWARAWC